jgi:hypothetical protein
MRRARYRSGLPAALSALVALLLLALAPAGLGGQVARAADRGLVVIAQTRYQAIPEERRVHVTIDAVATSYTPNPPDGLAYYPTATFALQPGATNISASANGQALDVAVDDSDPNFVDATVSFVDGVFFEQFYPYQVAYDLLDPGGAPDRNLRISPSIVALPIWAFGTGGEPGGSVTVVLPAGFTPTVQGDGLERTVGVADEVVLSTTSLPDPFNFFAYVSADRPGAFTSTPLTIDVGGHTASLNVKAWQDDPQWGATMSELMTDGLPTLQRLIGLPYTAPRTLTVEEAATSLLGEYAGIYNNQTGVIRVRYDADAYVGLHEAAHLWFNGDLFPDRWILEAFAEFYGVQAANAIGASGQAFDLTNDLLPSKIPLNDWGALGAVDPSVEEYAYAASYHLALLIFARADLPTLQVVWRAVEDHEMAYQPAHGNGTAEVGVDPSLTGWQELLDLLDERTGHSFDDLWTDWVVNPQQETVLQQRAVARQDYLSVVALAKDWNLPSDLRAAMGAWRFDLAEADLAAARTVLGARAQIAARADVLGLTPPGALQVEFEARNGLNAAQQEATAEIGALTAIATASDRLAESESLLELIGLIGESPGADLAAARVAFEADRLDAATADANRALQARAGAEAEGQTRVAIGISGILLVSGGTLVGVRLRRLRRSAAAARADAEANGWEPPTAPLDPPA